MDYMDCRFLLPAKLAHMQLHRCQTSLSLEKQLPQELCSREFITASHFYPKEEKGHSWKPFICVREKWQMEKYQKWMSFFCAIHWSSSAWKKTAGPDLSCTLQSATTSANSEEYCYIQLHIPGVTGDPQGFKKLVKQQTPEQQLQAKKVTNQNIKWLKMIREILKQNLASAALDRCAVLTDSACPGFHHTVITTSCCRGY